MAINGVFGKWSSLFLSLVCQDFVEKYQFLNNCLFMLIVISVRYFFKLVESTQKLDTKNAFEIEGIF